MTCPVSQGSGPFVAALVPGAEQRDHQRPLHRQRRRWWPAGRPRQAASRSQRLAMPACWQACSSGRRPGRSSSQSNIAARPGAVPRSAHSSARRLPARAAPPVAGLPQRGQVAGQQVPGQDGGVAAGLHQVQVGDRGQAGHLRRRRRCWRRGTRTSASAPVTVTGLGAVQRQVDDGDRRRHRTAAGGGPARR